MRGTVTGRVRKIADDGSIGEVVAYAPVTLLVPMPNGPFARDLTDEHGVFELAIRLDNPAQKPMLIFGESGFPPAVQTIDFSTGPDQRRDLHVVWRQHLVTTARVTADIAVDGHTVRRPTDLKVSFRTGDRSVEILSMRPIEESFSFGPVKNDMTVSMVSGTGRYDDEGHMSFDLSLKIDNSSRLVGDATLRPTLRTRGRVTTGTGDRHARPLERPSKTAILVGSANVQGSILGNKDLHAALDVSFDTLPLPFLLA